MDTTISIKDKKILKTGGIIIFILACYMFIIEPFITKHEDIRKNITSKGSLLKQYKDISENITKQGDKLYFYKNRNEQLTSKLLNGNKAPIAAAELQKLLQNITSKLGITIDSIRVIDKTPLGSFLQVPVEITIKCRMRKLRDMIYNIENNTKFLIISKITLKAINIKKPLDIETKVEVSGFIRNI